MNKHILSLSLIVATAIGLPCAGHANHKLEGATIKNIQGTARALQQDAAIYQHKRTITEVGQLVVDVQKLQRALAPHACLKSESESLGRTMTQLRSARMTNDIERINAAVARLSSLTTGLLQKDCGVTSAATP